MARAQLRQATTAHTLIEGYCQDFVRLAASLAQTLEQVSMRGLPIDACKPSLRRVESGMRNLADAISAMLDAAPAAAAPGRPGQPGQALPSAAPRPGPGGARPGGAPPKAEDNCIIQGDTSSMPITSVFQFLTRIRKDGVLAVEIKDERIEIEVVDGCVQATISDAPPKDENLLHALQELNLTPQRQAEALAGRVKEGGDAEYLAELLRSGVVSDEQIKTALQHVARRRIGRLLKMKKASYAFHEGEPKSNVRVRIRMPIRFADRLSAPIAQSTRR